MTTIKSRFNFWLIMRLSSFQIGSAMTDILLAGVWNRVMISDFGIPATPVGLLIALKNFMAPLSLWAGHRSDTVPLFGRYRTAYIWTGRGLIVLALPLLGLCTVRLEASSTDVVGWLLAVLSFLMSGIGTLLSGSPFLALVRDSAPKDKQGVAIGLVETVLIALFPIVAIGFSRLLATYDEALFWRLILIVMGIGGFFWFFAIVGAEPRRPATAMPTSQRGMDKLRQTFDHILADQRTRAFFVFLFVSTFSAWMQDNILEPFGADLFGMTVEETTRLTSYWGTPTILILVGCFIVLRRQPPERQSSNTRTGLVVMGVGLALVGVGSVLTQSLLFILGLVVFGAGFGLYTFGALSLMAVMSPDPDAGAYLGLWTVAILVSKGLGTFSGGLLRDVTLGVGLNPAGAYAIIFFLAATGLIISGLYVTKINIVGFVQEKSPIS